MPPSQPKLVLEWSPVYSVGVAEFDNEHQKFFQLIRNLYEAMKMGTSRSVIGALLGEIYAYSASHMTHEEEILELYGFAETEEHRRLHKEFRVQLREYMDDFEKNRGPIALSLLQFLQEWLENHVKTVDKRYDRFLAARGVR